MINRHWCIQGTIYRNSQLRYTHIMYCIMWEECKQTQCPHRSWRERTTALMWYYSPTKDKLIYQVRTNTGANYFWLSGQCGKYNRLYSYSTPRALFPQKWCVAPEFFILISSHSSTQIWRMRYGGSWSINFLVPGVYF